jgi:hypothetical protein
MPGEGLDPKADENYFTPKTHDSLFAICLQVCNKPKQSRASRHVARPHQAKTTQQWNKGSRLARLAVSRNPTGQTSEEEEEGSQRDDEPVGGAGDHGPGAGVDGVDIPLGHQPLVVVVPQPALHRHQRRHCTRGGTHAASELASTAHQTLNPSDTQHLRS